MTFRLSPIELAQAFGLIGPLATVPARRYATLRPPPPPHPTRVRLASGQYTAHRYVSATWRRYGGRVAHPSTRHPGE